MAPYRILTDSTTDLSPALVEKMNVTVMPLTFTMDGKTYRNTPDEADMSSKVFYDKVRAGSMPTTSQLNPMDFKEAVGPILAGGEDVLYLAFSSAFRARSTTPALPLPSWPRNTRSARRCA